MADLGIATFILGIIAATIIVVPLLVLLVLCIAGEIKGHFEKGHYYNKSYDTDSVKHGL